METEVQVYFDNIEDAIIKELKKAKKTIKLAVAWINILTYFKIFNDLLENNVKIEIVISNDVMNSRYLELLKLLEEKGVKVKLINMLSSRNYMHHKFCIIDDITILSGSYNWTSNAKKNFENLMVIKDTLTVKKFIAEFKLLMAIDKKLLNELQGLEKCEQKKCKGFMCNLLVFEFVEDKYEYLNVDIISVCSKEYEEHSIIMKSDIETNNLNIRIHEILNYYRDLEEDSYEESSYNSKQQIEDFCDYDIKQCLDKQLSDVKKYKGITIHGIGFIEQEPFGTKGDVTIVTKVKWKNKFAASFIPDTYHSDLTEI